MCKLGTVVEIRDSATLGRLGEGCPSKSVPPIKRAIRRNAKIESGLENTSP